MADVSVEFGAKDTGLEQTLQRIQGELTDLKGKLTSSDLSMTEIGETMKRIGQVQSMEKRLRGIGEESSGAAEKIKEFQDQMRRAEEITKSNRTALEVYSDRIDELQKHLDAGTISQKTYASAVEKAEAALKAATPETEESKRANAELATALKETEDQMRRAEAVTKANRSATQIYNDEVQELQVLLGAGRISMETFEKAVAKADAKLAAASPQIEETGKDLTEMGDKGEQGAKKLEFSLKNVGLAAGVAAAAAKATTAAIDLAFAGVQKTIQSFGDALDMGGRLSDLSERTGVATDKLLLMERAMNNTGVGADSLGPLINKMQKNIVDAADGSSKAADALTELGIPLSSLQSLTPDEQFQRIGRAIADVEDPAKRAAISMEIFGKSGGALNQLFSNLDGELANASRELGVMPAIMAELGSRFDGISDKLAVVQGKFVEFAAGILSKVVPVVEAIATGLANIDAASLGQKLADAFVGAGNAMRGFESAIAAMKVGNLGTAFELVFESIKLQLKETGNSIWNILSAAFKTATDFLVKTMGPSSAGFALIETGFKILGAKIQEGLFSGLANAWGGMGPLFAKGAETAKYQMETAARSVEMLTAGLGAQVELVRDQMTEAGAALPESFDKHLAQSTALFDTQQELDRINELTDQVNAATAATTTAREESVKHLELTGTYQENVLALEEAIADATNKGNQALADRLKQQLEAVKQQEAAKNKQTDAEREKARADAEALKALQAQKALELQIAELKAQGKDQQAEQLEKQKVYNDALQEATEKLKMSKDEAQNYATRMANAAYPVKTIRDILDEIAQKKIDNPVKSLGEQTDETKAKLKEMAGVLGQDLSRYNFSDVMKKLGLDSFGLTTTKEKIDAINAELKRIEGKPVGIAVDVKEESVKDVEEKIKGIGKDPIQTRLDVDKTSLDAALAQTKVEMQNEFVSTASASGGDGGEGGEGGEGGAASLEETIMDKIQTAVEAIRVAVVEKIEPKLPQTALI